MSELVPAGDVAPARSLLSQLSDPAGGNLLNRLKTIASQEPIRRMLPWFLGVAAIGGVALIWAALAPSPQRTLYSQLNDGERASVVETLNNASIGYSIDNQTGALTVNESDFHRARMLVAADGALAIPQSGTQLLDSLPMGASRTLESERLRAAREHDLMLTIKEIDGVDSVRVHLAESARSVFVRENLPATASVMVRLARGRHLSDRQVNAITNLVAGSVPGLSVDAVRVVDQHGQLLSDRSAGNSGNERLELQTRIEDKLRTQVTQLLTPMLGEGNFSSEIQVELDMDQVTSASESYDKDGAVRSESEQQTRTEGLGEAVGVPGVLSNTPPPAATAQEGPPEGTDAQPPRQFNGQSSSSRTYELGRQVSVANAMPGEIKRLSVAVAISENAAKGIKPADIEQIKQLVHAAVGAREERGDQVTVLARSFRPMMDNAIPFYEMPWFATMVRNAIALLAVVLVLFLGVRPLIKSLRRNSYETNESLLIGAEAGNNTPLIGGSSLPATTDHSLLSQKLIAAQRIAAEEPDSAVAALRQMLNQRTAEPAR